MLMPVISAARLKFHVPNGFKRFGSKPGDDAANIRTPKRGIFAKCSGQKVLTKGTEWHKTNPKLLLKSVEHRKNGTLWIRYTCNRRKPHVKRNENPKA
jgi:hypothetical protein